MRHPSREPGFSLLEILVTVGLMALLTALFLPNLKGVFRFEIRASARTLAKELEYASQRAIATGSIHRWVVDLDKQLFRLERIRGTPLLPDSDLPSHGELLDLRAPLRLYELLPVENRAGEWRSLQESGVWIDRVWVGDEEVRAGSVSISFGSDGGTDPAVLLVADEGGHRLRVILMAFTAEVRILEDA